MVSADPVGVVDTAIVNFDPRNLPIRPRVSYETLFGRNRLQEFLIVPSCSEAARYRACASRETSWPFELWLSRQRQRTPQLLSAVPI